MKKIVLIFCLIVLCISILSAQIEPGEALPMVFEVEIADSLNLELVSEMKIDSLFYQADSIRAYYDDEQIYLYNNSLVEYGQSSIQADSLYLDLKNERAATWGTTLLRDRDQLLIGRNVRYLIRSQTGILEDGHSFMDDGYYDGKEIRKISRNAYDIDGGSFTTCDHEEPAYWFWAQKMRIYQRDKVVGKHVLAYVNHIPVFYFPFITMSIKRGRERGWLIPSPGYNNNDGKYIKDIAYYIPYKDLADFTTGLDLMEKTGWKLHFDTRYTRRYHHNGGFNAVYQKNIGRGTKSFDWSLKGNHHQDLPQRSSLDLLVDFISNKRIYQSSGDLDESLAQWLSSSLSYRKPLGSTYFNAAATYNQDLINDSANLSLPTLSWSLPSRPFYEILKGKSDAWYSGLSYRYNVRLDHSGNLKKKGPNFSDYIWQNTVDPADSTRFLVEHHLGVKHGVGISNSYNYRGWLNLRQNLDYSEAWYDRDKNDKQWVRGSDHAASMNASFNLYGMRNFSKGKVSALRHVLSPNLGLSYQPDFEHNRDFYSFGGVSLRQSKQQLNLNMGLDQKWQMKLGQGKAQRRLNELFSLGSRVSANLKKKDKPFGSISHTLNFRPESMNLGSIQNGDFQLDGMKLAYAAQMTVSQDTYKIKLKNPAIQNHYFSQNISLGGAAKYWDYFPPAKNRSFNVFGDQEQEDGPARAETNQWSLSVSHDLYAPKSFFKPQSQNLRMNASFKLTKNYSLSYGTYYNLKKKELLSQSLHISRDLHCWKLDLSFNKRNEYWDYRLVFFNIKFPDALKFQTHDSKRY